MLKYQQIAANIEENIYKNDLQQDTKLPTVENFAAEYNVSKSTIVKALESLVSKGLVYQVQGSGIFVRRRNHNGYINISLPTGFTNTLKECKITSKVLDCRIIKPNEEIAKYIECSLDDDIYEVKRIRYIDGKIMCYEDAYYKKSIVPYLSKEIAQKSIYEYLKTALNITAGFFDRYLHVGTVGKELSDILELDSNSPALTAYDQAYLPSGVIFNYSRITYHYKHAQFYLQTSTIK